MRKEHKYIFYFLKNHSTAPKNVTESIRTSGIIQFLMHILWGQRGLGHWPHLFTEISNFAPHTKIADLHNRNMPFLHSQKAKVWNKRNVVLLSLSSLFDKLKMFLITTSYNTSSGLLTNHHKCRLVLDMGFLFIPPTYMSVFITEDDI